MKYLSLFSCLFCLFSFGQEREKLVTVKKDLKLMGARFEVTLVVQNQEIGYINIQEAIAEIKRIEKMISSWDAASETSLINKNAGIQPVKVSWELYKLIERSKKISELTDGAFDITYAAIDDIWKFDGSMQSFPDDSDIKESIAKIGYDKIILDEKAQTVYLKDVGMQIGFGAIGKGFAADKTKDLLISKGVKAGLIDASGDMTTWGTKATGEKWMIGIADPLDKGKIFSWFPIIESSVATSKNNEKHLIFKGEKYSHIIDPRTGYPVKGIKSVSIFAKEAELCDALATAIFALGKDSGMQLINEMRGVELVVVDGSDRVHSSSGILLSAE